jgi:hypothetical protein
MNPYVLAYNNCVVNYNIFSFQKHRIRRGSKYYNLASTCFPYFIMYEFFPNLLFRKLPSVQTTIAALVSMSKFIVFHYKGNFKRKWLSSKLGACLKWKYLGGADQVRRSSNVVQTAMQLHKQGEFYFVVIIDAMLRLVIFKMLHFLV